MKQMSQNTLPEGGVQTSACFCYGESETKAKGKVRGCITWQKYLSWQSIAVILLLRIHMDNCEQPVLTLHLL